MIRCVILILSMVILPGASYAQDGVKGEVGGITFTRIIEMIRSKLTSDQGQGQPAAPGAKIEATTIKSKVDELFLSSGCFSDAVMPALIAANSYIPKELAPIIAQEAGKKVVLWEGVSAIALLHSATFKTAAKDPDIPITADSSESYSSFDVAKATDGVGANSFYYSIDCTGYFSMAVAADVKFGVNAKTAAQSLLNNNKTLIYARAKVKSPIASALTLSGDGTLRSTLDVMYSTAVAAKQSGAVDDSIISAPRFLEMAWTSASQSGKFTGQATFDASGSASAGIFSFSGAGDAKATVSKSYSFKDFNTFVFQTVQKVDTLKFKELVSRVVGQINSTGPSSMQRGQYGELSGFYDLARGICNLRWEAFDSSNVDRKYIGQVDSVSAGPCRLTTRFNPGVSEAAKKSFALIAKSELGELVVPVLSPF